MTTDEQRFEEWAEDQDYDVFEEQIAREAAFHFMQEEREACASVAVYIAYCLGNRIEEKAIAEYIAAMIRKRGEK